MKALVEVVCRRGGRILEVGYGLGISAKYIDEHGEGLLGSRVTEHVIIEANAEIAANAREFAKHSKVKPLSWKASGRTWWKLSRQVPSRVYYTTPFRLQRKISLTHRPWNSTRWLIAYCRKMESS